jgi:hypothetical protein
MEISTLGIDLSKTTFHVIGLNARGEIVLRKKFSRKQLLVFTANRQQILIGTEACGGAHHLARALEFDCLCRPATRGLHYGQELVSTNRPDTFAQTKPPTTTMLLAISRRTIQFPWPVYRQPR